MLDEPSNFLDREALGGLAVAIRDWAGAVVIISHNQEFISALCASFPSSLPFPPFSHIMPGSEVWNIDNGRMTHKGKTSVVEDAFADTKSPSRSGQNTPARSRVATPKGGTPAASAAATPAGSGGEGGAAGAPPQRKKKKLTRNQIKAQEERRRARKLQWLTSGGPKPEDTDSD